MNIVDDFDIALDADTIQEYHNSADRNLTAPSSKEENSTFAPGKEPGLGSWTEKLRIRDTDMAATKSDPTNRNKVNIVLTLEVIGSEGGGFKTNAGRTHTEYCFIDKAALASGDPKVSGPYKRRLASINSLLAACGISLADGVPSYKAWFTGNKDLVGQTVAGVFRKYRNKKTGEVGCNIDGFTAAT